MKVKQMAEEKGLNDFRGGTSWCNRLFKRNQLTIRAWTNVGQKMPDGWEEKKEFFLSM